MTISPGVDMAPSGPRSAGIMRSAGRGIARLRSRLELGDELDDDAIAASLRDIRRATEPLAKLQAALDTTLGHWLALTRVDLPAALAALIDEAADDAA